MKPNLVSVPSTKRQEEQPVPSLDIKAFSTNKENQAKHRLQDYELAVKKIKDATGVTDLTEIVKKFTT